MRLNANLREIPGMYDRYDMERMVRTGAVHVEFQPVFSIREKSVTGFEAMVDGREDNGSRVHFDRVVAGATNRRLIFDFDLLCQKRSVEKFCKMENVGEVLLYLNIEAAIADVWRENVDKLFAILKKNKLDPGRVVVEMDESRATNHADLDRFIEILRSKGCLVSFDHMGAGNSNLEHVSRVMPDFLKIDRSLIEDIVEQDYKKQVFGLMMDMGGNMGAIVVADGVETEEQALCCLELGADYLQWFGFTRTEDKAAQAVSESTQIIGRVAKSFRDHMLRKTFSRKTEHYTYARFMEKVIERLSVSRHTEFDRVMKGWVRLCLDLECMYVINAATGMQESATVCSPGMPGRNPIVFRPADIGADHSMKEYFFLINSGMERHVTDPYVSRASGSRCITMSMAYKCDGGGQYILCGDFVPRRT